MLLQTPLEPRSRAWSAAVVVLAGVYFLTARMGLSLGVAEQVTAVWPPTGIALAAVLILGRGVWPGIWAGALAANLASSEPFGTALGIATGNTLEALVSAWLLQRARFSRRLERLWDVLVLVILAAGFASAVSATIGVTSLGLGGVHPWSDLGHLWWVWWLGDAMGALLVAPFLLVWTVRGRARPLPSSLLEFCLLLAACTATSYIVFARPAGAQLTLGPLPYAVFPFVIWAALRFRQRGTTLVVVLVSAIAIWATARGLETFGLTDPGVRMLHLQGFMAIIAITGLMLGAAIGERDGLLAGEQAARNRAEVLAGDLRAQEAAKDRFLAMLGHELRNPLAPVANALAILRLRDEADADARALHARMERQIRHMTRLVDDLLDVSRIGRGTIELRRERVDLATVVEHAVESVRPLVDERRHRLAVAVPAAPLRVDGDPTRLEQILVNLLGNAARYTPPGGSIELALEREGSMAVLRVRDDGIGIAPEILPHLFDAFVQAERVPGSVREGLGVGLTLVRVLVELHGGTVHGTSAGLGQGSEFVVRLPLAATVEEPVEPRSTAPVASAVARPGKRILVVDDNEDSAETLAMLLQLDGHEIEVAHDGPEALAKFRARRPDIVFLDIELPRGMSGHDVARSMARDRGKARVVLVAVTGYGQAEDRARSREAGFHAHLVKPIAREQLQDVLRELG